MAATALAEQYRELGFRVIEGGKSGKLAILRTPAVAEIFGKRHFHVLGDVREYQEKLPPNLVAAFVEHCRPSKYRGNDNTERDCFELTKVGFATVATKYDGTLRFLLALAFDALERADEAAQSSLIIQINARIRELRSRASGQDELALAAPASSQDVEAAEIIPLQQPDDGLVPVSEPITIAFESKPELFPRALEMCRAHHYRDAQGNHYASRRYLDRGDKELVEFWIYAANLRPANMQEVFLMDDTTGKQFLFRYDVTVTPLIAQQLLTRECGLSSAMQAATLKYLMDGRFPLGVAP